MTDVTTVRHPVMLVATLAASLAAAVLLLAPAARAAAGIAACDTAGTIACHPVTTVTEAAGVYFAVSTGGGNRDFATVEVICSDAAGGVVYATVLTVIVPAKGTGSSTAVHPPASSCVANLEKQQSIGKARILGSVSFAVTA